MTRPASCTRQANANARQRHVEPGRCARWGGGNGATATQARHDPRLGGSRLPWACRRARSALLVSTVFTWGGSFLVVPATAVHSADGLGWAVGFAGGVPGLLVAASRAPAEVVLVRPHEQKIAAALADPVALGRYVGVASRSVGLGGGLDNVAAGLPNTFPNGAGSQPCRGRSLPPSAG